MRLPTAARGQRIAALCVLALAGVIAGCGEDDSDSRRQQRLRLVIGDSVPDSGRLADLGPGAEKAAEMAEDVIDRAVAEVGSPHRVSVVHTDNGGGSDPGLAVSGARALVDEQGTSCIAGAWATTDTLRIAREVAIPERTVMISPAAQGDALSDLDDDGLVNRTIPPDSFQGPAIAAAIAAHDGVRNRTVNVGARDDAYGRAIADTFAKRWRELGGTVGREVVYDPTALDFGSTAERLVGGEPDATVILDFPESFRELAGELVETGEYRPGATWAGDGLALGLPEAIDPGAVDGLRGVVPGVPDADRPTQAFHRRYRATEPRDVIEQPYDARNFDAVVLCYLAAVAAGSSDGDRIANRLRAVSAPPGDPYTWEELPEAVEALERGEQIDYQGASGGIDLDDAGDATAGAYYVYEYRDRELRIVDEVSVTAP